MLCMLLYCTPVDVARLNELYYRPSKDVEAAKIESGILPTKLFTHRKDADAVNNIELQRLSGI